MSAESIQPSSPSTDSAPQRNSNNLPAAAAANCTGIDSSTSSPQFLKKTRDLPNLSECHNCGYRINTTNGRDKLQTLRSEWRIVLLCRKCARLVNSGKLCPYCFLEVLSEDEKCFKCCDCDRRVHERCVLMYKGFAPSGYYCCFPGGVGFTVCLDCWLPKPLLQLRSQMVKRDSRSRRVIKRGNDNQDVMKDSVKAGSAVEKVMTLLETREMVSAKRVPAVNRSTDSSSADMAVIDDAELAIQLHRSLNSSHRVLRNSGSVSSCSLSVQETMFCQGTSSVRASSKFREEEEKSCSDKVINSSSDDNETEYQSGHLENEMRQSKPRGCLQSDSYRKIDRYCIKYSRRRSSLKLIHRSSEAHPDDIEKHCQSGLDQRTCRHALKYSRRKSSSKVKVGGNRMHTDDASKDCRVGYNSKHDRYCFKYRKRNSSSKVKVSGNQMHLDDTSIDGRVGYNLKRDRYCFKYRKRNSSSKVKVSGNQMHLDDTSIDGRVGYNLKRDRYCFKYRKRNSSFKINERAKEKLLDDTSKHCVLNCEDLGFDFDFDLKTNLCCLTYSRRNSDWKASQIRTPWFLYEDSHG